MTSPAERCATLVCGHPKTDHERDGFWPQCTAPGCSCVRYREAVRPTQTTAAGTGPRIPIPPAPAAVPAAAPAQVRRLPEPEPPAMPEPSPDKPIRLTVTELLRRGRDSELKPIVKLAARIDADLEDLRERVTAEIHAADLKTAIAELEAQLNAKKGELAQVGKGTRRRTPPEAGTSGEHACPDCGDTFTTRQGVGAHRAKKHGYRKAG